MKIYCCSCQKEIDGRLTTGREVYPSRADLYDNPYWICDCCKNYVGYHHKSSIPTKPLGTIPTPEIRKLRRTLHKMIDPLWRDGHLNRDEVYSFLSQIVRKEFHVSTINTEEEGNMIIERLNKLGIRYSNAA